MRAIEEAAHQLGHSFTKLEFLRTALTHKSFVNENPDENVFDNERMEFLGDAVLGLLITEFLYRKLESQQEGHLSKLKSYMISEAVLAGIAEEYRLGSFLMLGKGEDKTGGREKASILANTLEAVLAAIYLDGGLEAARAFVFRAYESRLSLIEEEWPNLMDYKSALQEFLQARSFAVPSYHVVSEQGPDHEKVFTIELRVEGEVRSMGQGTTKKEAQQNAARSALAKMTEEARSDDDNDLEVP